MKNAILTVAFSLLCFWSKAITITWVGGSGAWDIPGHWSPAMVPTAADDVFISTGTVNINSGYQAYASSVLIQSNLTIQLGASLNLGNFNGNFSGLRTSGITSNYGTINISNVSTSSPTWLYGNGIFIGDGGFTNQSSGVINLNNIDKAGILLDDNCYFYNEGAINISNTEIGIHQYGSTNSFTNYANSTIFISSTGSNAIHQLPTNNFYNEGNIDISASIGNNGLYQQGGGNFQNYASGNLTISHATNHGVYSNGIGASFANLGTLLLSDGIGGNGIYLAGAVFTNGACAMVATAAKVYVINTANSLINNGWIISTYTGAHLTFTNSFVNNGVLQDNNGAFTSFTNNAIAINEVPGLHCEDGIVPNMFDLGAGAGSFNLQGNNFYTGPGLNTVAGTFTPATNSFDPNSNAVGLTQLYFQVTNPPNGCNQIFSVRFELPMQPPAPTYYADTDFDGYGNSASTLTVCSAAPPYGYSANDDDCNDNDPLERPGQTWFRDADDDDYTNGTTQTQCLRPVGYKALSELLAGVDCNDNDPLERPGQTWFRDADDDDYTNGITQTQCLRPVGYKALSELLAGVDCDDNDPLEFPGQVWYKDADADDYSNGTSVTQCIRPANHYAAIELVATTGDCDDTNPNTYPTAPEICDDEDNDCDGTIDEGVCGTTCADPRVLTGLPYSYTGTTEDYGDEYDETDACTSAWMRGNDFVFQFLATTSQIGRIQLINNGIPPGATFRGHAVFVLDGCPDEPSTNCLYSKTHNSATNSPIYIETVNFMAGTTYYIVVASNPNLHQWFDFSLNIDLPVGNICENAETIPSIPYTFSGTTQLFGDDYSSADACNSAWMGGNDFVFKYTAAANEVARIRLQNDGIPPGATFYGHAVFVLNGYPNVPGTSCLYSKTYGIATNSPIYIETVHFQTAGIYYIVVASHPNFHQWYNFTIDIDHPMGNICQNAVDIPNLPFTANSQSTCLFGKDYGYTAACNSNYMSGNDFVYKLIPTMNASITISLSNLSGSFTGIFLLNGCPNASGVTCAKATNNGSGNYALSGQSVTAGNTYYIVIDSDNNVTTCFNYDIEVSMAPLPVELARFSVDKQAEKTALMRWETASEINFSHYEIERSTDLLPWKQVGFMAAEGGNTTSNYKYLDDLSIPLKSNPNGQFYYRLKMVDSDGQYEYSPVKTIQFESEGTGFLAWPNPSSGSVSLRPLYPADDGLELVLTDIAGKFVLRQSIDFEQNETVVLEKWQLPGAGYYVLKIMENGKTIWQDKLLVTDY